MLAELLEKRLIIVSGKGGVGKTTVSVLLALLAAKLKKRTLLCEMNSAGQVAPLFGTTSNGQKEISLAPYISGINLSPNKCFEEYVLKHIRFKGIYQAFFNNKFVSNFLDAVPGLNDILMLGKIYELEKQYKSKLLNQLSYDLIIVDAPATGHNLSTLEVPNVLKNAVKIGPLHKHANGILELLANENKTVFTLVTLAEEMPVNESREYISALKEKTKLHFGPIFVNSVFLKQKAINHKSGLTKDAELLANYYTLAAKRAELNKRYIDEINRLFTGFEKVVIPFQFSHISDSKDLNNLLKVFEEHLH